MKMVRITRSVTVTLVTPASGYLVNAKRDNERVMTDSEIVKYEKGMPEEDQAQAIAEYMEIADGDKISFTCDVTFEEVPDEGSITSDEEVWPPGMGSV